MQFSELNLLAQFAFISEQRVLVDVGAHHGSVSLRFARQGWQVIAFEPERQNYVELKHKLAELDNVICIPKAVSDVTGKTVPFYVSDEHYGIHSLKPFHRTHRLAYQVETTTLNDALQQLSIDSVTLLKVDIEGADFLALKGFDLSKYRPEIVMIEFMDERSLPNFGYSHHHVVDYMNANGYSAFVSEWEPVKEYGKEGANTAPHTWIQCAPYPLDHEPAWGNLILVPDRNHDKFSATLGSYLRKLKQDKLVHWIRGRAKNLPGTTAVYHLLRGR